MTDIQILPSVLAADFAALGAQCTRVMDGGASGLHFDVMDGQFVNNISFGVPVLASLKKALPKAEYDVHLMIESPINYVEAFANAGADYITFHIEAVDNAEEIIAAIRNLGLKVGISLRPATPVETLFPFLSKIDQVLVMSVDPGFGGQSFMPESAQRINALRTQANKVNNMGLRIMVDGGINEQTGAICAVAGANALVAGSSVFGADNPECAITLIKKACNVAISGGSTTNG